MHIRQGTAGSVLKPQGAIGCAALLLVAGTISLQMRAQAQADADRTAPALLLARDGQALLPIVIGHNAIAAEQTAAVELAEYLQRITGAAFQAVGEAEVPPGAAAVYLGHTAFARQHGVDVRTLGAEESVLRTVDGSLLIAGGRPRGVLYAVYTFLEDVLGCRWYTAWAEKVPKLPTCPVPPLDRRFKPAFALRSGYTRLPDRLWTDAQKEQWPRYLVRNRINGPEATYKVWWKWRAPNVPELIPGGDTLGGSAGLRHGGPHSFARYFPADKYFGAHPEWYSVRRGARVPSNGADGNHLCLTNPELRKVYTEKIRRNMRASPDVALFSVAMNDGGNPTACDCERCTSVADRTSWTDLYIEFLNELADGVRDEFPDQRIWTIAYSFAGQPPRSVKARDNIMVMACLLNSNRVTLAESAEGEPFGLPKLTPWAEACSTLQVWDYVEWGPPYYSLAPVYFRMQEQYRFCRDLVVVGVFAENEISASRVTMSEFYPLRLWLFAKLVENPDRDLLALIRDFMDGYYGPAGPFLYDYVKSQHARLPLWPHRMVDLEFVDAMQRQYGQAEAAVSGNPVFLERVLDARIWADMTTLLFKNKLADEFVRQGGEMAGYPYRSAVLKERILNRLAATQSPFWASGYPVPYPKGPWTPLSELTAQYVETLSLGNEYAPLPEPFSDMDPAQVVSVPGYQMTYCQKAQLSADAGSVFGVVSARLTADELPVSLGVYDYTRGERGETVTGRDIAAAEVPGPGYHVYKVGRTTISTNCRFWFTKSWQIQQPLAMFHDPSDMGREWDVYVSAKLDGPDYPHGDADAANGAYIERLILVRVGE